MTPRTKHIGIPHHWFCTQVERLEIQTESIDTTDQLGDHFTKGLPVDAFRLARKRLTGWWPVQLKGRVRILRYLLSTIGSCNDPYNHDWQQVSNQIISQYLIEYILYPVS